MGDEIEASSYNGYRLIAAFLAMEPTDWVISLAREFGGGSITQEVQRFISEHCINGLACNNPNSHLYIKSFLKKVILAAESSSQEVLDGLYEQYVHYMTSFKDDTVFKGTARVYKRISFIFPGHSGDLKCPIPKKMVVPLRCSLNMLEGDTGCCVWPSSLFLSECILSFPETFLKKCCVEVGAGLGLVGICLASVNASKVTLTDGGFSTLVNMKHNLEQNLSVTEAETKLEEHQNFKRVECKYLSWESASESELQNLGADIVLGADVIYDPLCVPHLVRVLAALLKQKNYWPHQGKASRHGGANGHDFDDNDGGGDHEGEHGCCRGKMNGKYEANKNNQQEDDDEDDDDGDGDRNNNDSDGECSAWGLLTKGKPMAMIATVIRNMDTFNYFLKLSHEAHLTVVDVTENMKPLELLSYMYSYDRSSIRMYNLTYSGS